MLPAHELSLPVTMKVRERGGKEEGGREGGRKGEKERERERERGKKGGKEGKSGRGRKVGAVTSMFMTKDDTGTWMSGKFSRGISFLTPSDSAHKVGLA